jgi:hypothetical protein
MTTDNKYCIGDGPRQISGPTCYPRSMPSLNIRRVGDGPRCYAVWLDHWPVFLDGLDGLPHIGDRFEIDGERWRVVVRMCEIAYNTLP